MTATAKNTLIYKIVAYTKTDYTNSIHVDENWNINLYLKSVQDAKTVAKLAGVESYGIFKYETDDKGYTRTFSEDCVYITADAEQWKALIKKQSQRNEKALDEAIARVNALPKKVTVYKEDEVLATATRSEYTKNYGGSDVKYRLTISVNGEELSTAWHGYQSEGYGKGKKILKKKFAQDIYQATHQKEHHKQGWNEWKETLKNIPLDFVQKYGIIIEKIYENLEKYQQTIYKARNGE